MKTHAVADRMRGKRALVTAAGAGIGRATVERFVIEGAEVLAVDKDAAALETLAAACDCATAIVDLTDAAAVAALIEQGGGNAPFDVLASFAGYVASGSILDCSERDWAASFDLNVTAMYRLIRAVLPGMIANGHGSIVTMASVAGSIRGVPNRCAYGATKAAVIGLTKAVAADHVAQGIRANAICPGTVETPSLYERLSATGDYAAAHAQFVSRQPMGRLGRASEIADLAVYLASDESAFTTGQIHVVDGGWAN